jgi:hypothetical protein
MRISTIATGSAALAMLASSVAGAATLNHRVFTQSHVRPALHSTSVLAPGLQGKVHAAPHFGVTHIGLAGSCPSAPVGFISDFNNSEVYELDRNGNTCATLTGFTNPQGMSTDKSGNLWVANTDAENILEINPSNGNVIATYNDAGQYPVDVCVANNSGNFAVPTIFNANTGGPGEIDLFTSGNTSGPTGVASGATYTSPRFCAYDKTEHYVVFDDADIFNTGANNVGAIAPGNYTGTKNIVALNTSNSIEFPGGVQFNGNQQPVIDDQEAFALYTYNVSGTTLNVAQTTPLSQASDPVSFAFAPGYGLALTADAGLAAAQLYKYPAGGAPLGTFPVGSGSLPIGAAIIPTAQFSIR